MREREIEQAAATFPILLYLDVLSSQGSGHSIPCSKSLKLAAFVSWLNLRQLEQIVNATFSVNMLNADFYSSEHERRHCMKVQSVFDPVFQQDPAAPK